MGSLRSLRAIAGAACAAGLAAGFAALSGACGEGGGDGKGPSASASRGLTLALPFGRAASAPQANALALALPSGRATTASQANALALALPSGRATTAPPTDAPTAGPPRGPCPDDGMARIGAFCIDRHEAHLVTRGPDGLDQPWPHARRPEPGLRYESRSKAGAFPQGYVSRNEAAAACANAGKRLCALSEWRRACQGPRGAPYPYGTTARPRACNSGKAHLVAKFSGDDPGAWTYESFNSPALNLEPGFLARAGEYEGCGSEEGVYDLVGNLHEWVSDPVSAANVAPGAELGGQVRPGNGVFAGGFFSTSNQNGAGCSYVTLAHEPSYHDYSTGFRCCADADADADASAD